MMLYELVMYFFIYGFIGWCMEVCYTAIDLGEWSNRGFLNGTICPIYGFGVVAMLFLFEPLTDFAPLLFLVGVLVCTGIELLTGYVMEKVFHQRWWDYSKERFNYKGYVCLKFSIYWGFGVVFVMKLVHPSVTRFVDWIPYGVGIFAISLLMVLLALDLLDTFRSVIGINRELAAIHDAAGVMRKVSDEISGKLFEGTMRAVEEKEELGQKIQVNKEELELQVALGRAELDDKAAELMELTDDFVRRLKRGQARILRAFPDMRSTLYDVDMTAIREMIGKAATIRRK